MLVLTLYSFLLPATRLFLQLVTFFSDFLFVVFALTVNRDKKGTAQVRVERRGRW